MSFTRRVGKKFSYQRTTHGNVYYTGDGNALVKSIKFTLII